MGKMKLLIKSLKILPMLLAVIFLLSTILAYNGINIIILNYLGSISIVPLLFIYLASYALQFCAYHRMFLHYIVFCNILNVIDKYFTIPISAYAYLQLIISISFVFLFIIIYLKFRSK
jgi:hypothetical protein